MRFELTSQHREFFFQHHFIELSDVLTKQECENMLGACDDALEKRLGKNISLDRATEEERYLAGRDLFRADPEIKRFILKRRFGELFSQISHKRPLRLLFTQYLRTFSTPSPIRKKLPFLHTDHTLGESSCYQGVYGAIVLTFSTSLTSLPHSSLSVEDDVTVVCPSAGIPGNAVMVHEASPLSFSPIFHSENEAHLMLVYGEPNALYRHSKEDPMTHYPKTLGYTFGDVLKEDLNPIVYR